MDNLEKFDFKGKEVRTLVNEDGAIEWSGKDVATALGYKNPQDAIRKHCRKDGCAIRSLIDSKGRKQSAAFISEPNLYRLIAHSKLPSAEKFEKWVFEEVLPAIRKHGRFEFPEITDGTKMWAIRAMADSYKKQAELHLQTAIQMRNAVSPWMPKTQYGGISPRNGKPQLCKRGSCWYSRPDGKNGIELNLYQGTFDFYNEMIKTGE